VLFLLLAWPTKGQEPPPETPADLTPPVQEPQPPGETKPKAPPRPPEGILPVGEIARLSFAPSDRPIVFLHENRLVIVTATGAVEGHDASSGEFRWKLGLPGEALFVPVPYRSDPFEILLSSPSGRLFVIDAETGEIRGESQLPVELSLPPRVDLPLLYAGTPGGEVIAFDAEKGAERFRAQVGEAPLALASSGGTIIASGSERMLIALDSGHGGEKWRFRGRSGFHAPAVFARDRLYIGNDAGEFYCFALPSGDTKFRWATGASIRSAALVEEQTVFVTSFGNALYAYQSGGGAERYRVSLPGRPASAPIRFGRRLVVVTYDGAIVEVDPEKGAVSKTYAAPGELGSPPAFLVPLHSPGTEEHASRRIALALRTGEVLLLGHRAGNEEAPEEEEEKEPEPPPPGHAGARGEDSLSWK
jgi:outer membrane protein assembly factor BamB